MKNRYLLMICAGMLFQLVVCDRTCAQGQQNQMKYCQWAPTDHPITVSAPVCLKEVKLFEGRDKEDELPDDGYQDIRYFEGNDSYKRMYFVYAFHLKSKLAAKNTEEKIAGLEFLIGGDDDREFTAVKLKICDYPAVQITYNKQSGRAIIVDVGKQLYLIGFHSENMLDLNSVETNNFFSSLKLKLNNCTFA